MKYFGNFLLLAMVTISCNSQTNVKQSVFLQKMGDKGVLLANGFKPDVHHFKHLNDTGSTTFVSNDHLNKKIYDTSLHYLFNGDQVERYEVGFSIAKTDTSAIFGLLASLGFTREPGKGNVRSVFSNRSKKIRYEFVCGSRYYQFTSYPNGKWSTNAVMDSIRGPKLE